MHRQKTRRGPFRSIQFCESANHRQIFWGALLAHGNSDAASKATAANVNEEWVKYRVVIYTNSIECGVSFTQSHFDRFYGLFDNNIGPSHKNYIQMIKRVRCLRDNLRFLHIREMRSTTPSTPICSRSRFNCPTTRTR